MTPKISLAAAVAVAALVLVPPAWGDNWGADRQSRPDYSAVLDARKRVFDAMREAVNQPKVATPVSTKTGGDVVSRAVAARQREYPSIVRDDRFDIDPSNIPTTVSTTTSGREIEWTQVGIGFGVGILLMVGLFVALRATRIRQLAH